MPDPPGALRARLIATTDSLQRRIVNSGVIVNIYKSGSWQWAYATGINDLDRRTKPSPDLVFRAASISKMFCATAVLQLVAQGKLKLSDHLERYLPPGYTDRFAAKGQMTIEDLLQHTSGLIDLQSVVNPMTLERPIHGDTLLRLIRDLDHPANAYGQFQYANTNYTLLSAIIRQVSGMSYEKFLQTRVFSPLGLKDSYVDFLPSTRRFKGYAGTVKMDSTGAEVSVLADHSDRTSSWARGAADISSTTSDLLKFFYFLQHDYFFPGPVRSMMTAHLLRPMFRQSYAGYGYGTMMFELENKVKAFGHTGNGAGYTNLLCWIERLDAYVCVSVNRHMVSSLYFKDYLNRVVEAMGGADRVLH